MELHVKRWQVVKESGLLSKRKEFEYRLSCTLLELTEQETKLLNKYDGWSESKYVLTDTKKGTCS